MSTKPPDPKDGLNLEQRLAIQKCTEAFRTTGWILFTPQGQVFGNGDDLQQAIMASAASSYASDLLRKIAHQTLEAARTQQRMLLIDKNRKNGKKGG